MKIIKITAIWCVSCIIMNDIIDELKNELDLDLIEYDYDLNEEVKQYDVGKKLPVLIVLDSENKEIKRIVGERSKKELKLILEALKGEIWENT